MNSGFFQCIRIRRGFRYANINHALYLTLCTLAACFSLIAVSLRNFSAAFSNASCFFFSSFSLRIAKHSLLVSARAPPDLGRAFEPAGVGRFSKSDKAVPFQLIREDVVGLTLTQLEL